MGWPYDIAAALALSDDDKLRRRHAIDFYACAAHYSALLPPLAALLFRAVRRALRLRLRRHPSAAAALRYVAVPPSPVAKAHRRGHGFAASAARAWTRLRWWLCDNVDLYGICSVRRDEGLLGLAWTAWLLTLCVIGTGNDYLHVTKRFGAVAVSQLPVQFLLALKAINPFALAFGTSHEAVNRFHRTLSRVISRVIHILLATHIIFYNYFFLVTGIWVKCFFAPAFCGVVASFAFDAITFTSLARVRRYSYRLFFVIHLLSAVLIPILIFFHAPSSRFYLVETLLILVLDLAVRKFITVASSSTLELVPGTNLVKVSCPIPRQRLGAFKVSPGLHVYLSISRASRESASRVFDFLYNPFTVASVNDNQGIITLVARIHTGPMTRMLSQLASSSSSERTKIPVAIEGPYGTMGKHFRNLVEWGAARILIVAGGIGATFALPIYSVLRDELPSVHLRLVWAVRTADEAAWAFDGEHSILDDADDRVLLFLTGPDVPLDPAAGLEMATLPGGEPDAHLLAMAADERRRRPDLEKMVDATFRLGLEEPVAVLVCGPVEMALQVRRCVRPWAMQNREVWFHSETFGW